MLRYSATVRSLRNAFNLNTFPSTNLIHTSSIYHKKKKNKCPQKVAVVLCGCGGLDGTEATEAVSTMIHLSVRGLQPAFFAPDIDICGVVNHLTRNPEGPSRNALVESARIPRPGGESVKPLCECSPCDHVAIVIVGGFACTRTLSDFAAKGCECVILPELEKVLRDFNASCKPIATMCSASVLAARVFNGVKVTLGKDCPPEQWPYAELIEKVKQMGAKIEMRDGKGVSHCKEHDVYSTPAWMDGYATYSDVHEGIGKMIHMLRKSIK